MTNRWDFDVLDRASCVDCECIVLGQTYQGLKRLGMTLGARLRAVLLYTPPAPDALGAMTQEELEAHLLAEERRQLDDFAIIRRAIDHCFGTGTYDQWIEDDNFSAEYCGRVLQAMLDGFVQPPEDDVKNAEQEATAVA